MEGFCLKQHRFKTVTFGEIMAQMHLFITLFICQSMENVTFFAVFICHPSISGSLPFRYMGVKHTSFSLFIHIVSHLSFVCVCISPLYSLPLYTSSFLHSSICFLKKNHEENIWFTFAYFLSVFSITGVSFLPTWVWWWCSLLYLLGKQYCIFSAFNSLNYFTFWRSWRIPVGHIKYV